MSQNEDGLGLVAASRPYQATVAGVLHGADHAELVEHLTHNDDTHPQRGQTGGHGPEASVGHGQRPQHHQDQVHHGRLHRSRVESHRPLTAPAGGGEDRSYLFQGNPH